MARQIAFAGYAKRPLGQEEELKAFDEPCLQILQGENGMIF